ncbi:MAG: SMP-30/gluconolactonase/LRE family protein [Phycisphaerales bacterium]|nr:SMP-30/gluconolactonase/LRE family protein [Phycisphaerales bacterium]
MDATPRIPIPRTRLLRRARWILTSVGLAAILLVIGAGQNSPSDPATTARAQDATARFRVQSVRSYTGPADTPLFMPTGVRVAADGTVYVVDGVYDRIVVHHPSGAVREIISSVEDHALAAPLDVWLDSRGQLWIADTGNECIVVRAENGTLAARFTPPAELRPTRGFDLAGLALSPDERTLWVADNNHHRLLRCDLTTGAWETFGQRGGSRGEYQYPFGLATLPGGALLVVDVINGRLQQIFPDGTAEAVIGAYGVDLGQFYRPKAVAVDAAGRIWVADGTLGVIQIFATDGGLLGALADETGTVLQLDHPLGIAFGADDEVYVVELGAHRVRQFLLTEDPRAFPPRMTAGARGPTAGQQARACTVCHMEWMAPLVDGTRTLLAAVPDNPPDHPAVSRAEMCLGCHDGGVGDSRRRVWMEHGHRIGQPVPADVRVPPDLPLTGGQMACRTCHSAHTQPDTRNTLETIVFLRGDGVASDLCLKCHGDLAGGAHAGMHPLGPMKIAVPEQLHAPETRKLLHTSGVTCLTCHTGHGAQYEQLMVVDPNTNDMCLSCHEQLSPVLFEADHRSRHGHLPMLSAEQRDVATSLGTRTAESGALLCTTCHQAHHATVPQNLLAFNLAERDVCSACHTVQATVVATPHDLRQTAPDATNIHGVTVTQGGVCSACHTAHQPGLPAQPTALNPAGQCLNCHQTGQLAAKRVLPAHNHPGADCTGCHNPHEPRFGHFLSAPAEDNCRRCHANQSHFAGGGHDLRKNPEVWPEVSRDTGDACLACHRAHGSDETRLFRAGLAADQTGRDAACVACHAESAPGARTASALIHPQAPHSALVLNPTTRPVHLPLTTGPHGEQQLGCSTCHDPHQSPDIHRHLLRAERGAPPETLCLSCHTERTNIHMIGHAIPFIRAAGFEADHCLPCHTTHGDPGKVVSQKLWPRALWEFEGSAEIPVADRFCIACHRTAGAAPVPAVASHPDVVIFNPYSPTAANYLPLFDDTGEVASSGHIACRTCHLTHGRSEQAPLPEDATALGARELRARAWHLRSFGQENVCTTCHGFDGLRRFMYFHQVERRSGPVQISRGLAEPTLTQ